MTVDGKSIFILLQKNGMLAQLVQSACFTRMRSAVQVRYIPLLIVDK